MCERTSESAVNAMLGRVRDQLGIWRANRPTVDEFDAFAKEHEERDRCYRSQSLDLISKARGIVDRVPAEHPDSQTLEAELAQLESTYAHGSEQLDKVWLTIAGVRAALVAGALK